MCVCFMYLLNVCFVAAGGIIRSYLLIAPSGNAQRYSRMRRFWCFSQNLFFFFFFAVRLLIREKVEGEEEVALSWFMKRGRQRHKVNNEEKKIAVKTIPLCCATNETIFLSGCCLCFIVCHGKGLKRFRLYFNYITAERMFERVKQHQNHIFL